MSTSCKIQVISEKKVPNWAKINMNMVVIKSATTKETQPDQPGNIGLINDTIVIYQAYTYKVKSVYSGQVDGKPIVAIEVINQSLSKETKKNFNWDNLSFVFTVTYATPEVSTWLGINNINYVISWIPFLKGVMQINGMFIIYCK